MPSRRSDADDGSASRYMRSRSRSHNRSPTPARRRSPSPPPRRRSPSYSRSPSPAPRRRARARSESYSRSRSRSQSASPARGAQGRARPSRCSPSRSPSPAPTRRYSSRREDGRDEFAESLSDRGRRSRASGAPDNGEDGSRRPSRRPAPPSSAAPLRHQHQASDHQRSGQRNNDGAGSRRSNADRSHRSGRREPDSHAPSQPPSLLDRVSNVQVNISEIPHAEGGYPPNHVPLPPRFRAGPQAGNRIRYRFRLPSRSLVHALIGAQGWRAKEILAHAGLIHMWFGKKPDFPYPIGDLTGTAESIQVALKVIADAAHEEMPFMSAEMQEECQDIDAWTLPADEYIAALRNSTIAVRRKTSNDDIYSGQWAISPDILRGIEAARNLERERERGHGGGGLNGQTSGDRPREHPDHEGGGRSSHDQPYPPPPLPSQPHDQYQQHSHQYQYSNPRQNQQQQSQSQSQSQPPPHQPGQSRSWQPQREQYDRQPRRSDRPSQVPCERPSDINHRADNLWRAGAWGLPTAGPSSSQPPPSRQSIAGPSNRPPPRYPRNGRAPEFEVQLPREVISALIGKGGRSITDLQVRLNTDCYIEQREAIPRLQIWGTTEQYLRVLEAVDPVILKIVPSWRTGEDRERFGIGWQTPTHERLLERPERDDGSSSRNQAEQERRSHESVQDDRRRVQETSPMDREERTMSRSLDHSTHSTGQPGGNEASPPPSHRSTSRRPDDTTRTLLSAKDDTPYSPVYSDEDMHYFHEAKSADAEEGSTGGVYVDDGEGGASGEEVGVLPPGELGSQLEDFTSVWAWWEVLSDREKFVITSIATRDIPAEERETINRLEREKEERRREDEERTKRRQKKEDRRRKSLQDAEKEPVLSPTSPLPEHQTSGALIGDVPFGANAFSSGLQAADDDGDDYDDFHPHEKPLDEDELDYGEDPIDHTSPVMTRSSFTPSYTYSSSRADLPPSHSVARTTSLLETSSTATLAAPAPIPIVKSDKAKGKERAVTSPLPLRAHIAALSPRQDEMVVEKVGETALGGEEEVEEEELEEGEQLEEVEAMVDEKEDAQTAVVAPERETPHTPAAAVVDSNAILESIVSATTSRLSNFASRHAEATPTHTPPEKLQNLAPPPKNPNSAVEAQSTSSTSASSSNLIGESTSIAAAPLHKALRFASPENLPSPSSRSSQKRRATTNELDTSEEVAASKEVEAMLMPPPDAKRSRSKPLAEQVVLALKAEGKGKRKEQESGGESDEENGKGEGGEKVLGGDWEANVLVARSGTSVAKEKATGVNGPTSASTSGIALGGASTLVSSRTRPPVMVIIERRSFGQGVMQLIETANQWTKPVARVTATRARSR